MINGHDHTLGVPDAQIKIENLGGFRIRWEYNQGDFAVFCVWQVIAKQEDGLRLSLFLKSGTEGELTPDVLLADPYLSGLVKADGRVMMTGECVFVGPTSLKRHLSLQKYVWERSHDLMEVAPAMPWKEA